MCVRYSWPTLKSRAQPSTASRCAWVGCGVRRQAIADPHVDAFVEIRHFVGQVMEINGIDDRSAPFVDAHAERGDAAVRLVDEAQRRIAQAPVRRRSPRLDDRRIEVASARRHRRSAARGRSSVSGAARRAAPGRRAPARAAADRRCRGQWSAWSWVTITASIRPTSAVEQLLAKVGPAIDQQRARRRFRPGSTSEPAVARLVRIACAPVDCRSCGTPVDVPQPRIRTFTRRRLG